MAQGSTQVAEYYNTASKACDAKIVVILQRLSKAAAALDDLAMSLPDAYSCNNVAAVLGGLMFAE